MEAIRPTILTDPKDARIASLERTILDIREGLKADNAAAVWRALNKSGVVST